MSLTNLLVPTYRNMLRMLSGLLDNYARDWALPQFYFHVVTAYAILRNQGDRDRQGRLRPAYVRLSPARVDAVGLTCRCLPLPTNPSCPPNGNAR